MSIKKKFFAAGICVLAIFFFLAPPSYGADKVIMKVYLNTEDKGEYFLLMTPEKELLFRSSDLSDMGLVGVPRGAEVMVGDVEYVPMHSLSSWADIEVDEKELVMRVTAGPEHLRKNNVDFAPPSPIAVTRSADNSAFFNYNLNYAVDDAFRFAAFSASTELGASIEDFALYSNFSYIKTDQQDSFVRLLTSVTKDDIPSQRRYVAGDFFASTGTLGGGAYLGGLSVSKVFAVTPYFIKTAGLDLSGVLRTPSDVSVYINDNLVRSERMSPGEFDFLNVYNATGSGNATVVIKDAYGHEQKYTVPFYISSSLLKTGLSEYGYNIGFKRKDLGLKSFEYGGPAFAAFHNYGFSKGLTAGARAEADKDFFNVGPALAFLLGGYGEVRAAAAYSGSKGKSGSGGSLSYTYAGRRISGFATVSGFTRDYANLSAQAPGTSIKLDRSFNLGYNHENFGSLSATYSRTDYFGNDSIKRLSGVYTRRLFRDTSFHVIASRTKAATTVHEVFAGLTFLVGSNNSAGLNYQTRSGVVTEAAYIQNAQPAGTGLSYRLLAERTKDFERKTEFDGNANVQYSGSYGTYAADYRRFGGIDSYSLNVAGAMAFIDRSVYFTRPITDSFALVKVGDVSDVKVYNTNQEAGLTGGNGAVLVPNLISYQENYISIDDKDIPVNYSISEVSRTVTPLNRSGVVVMFDSAKLQGFAGKVFIRKRGVKTPAEYATMEVNVQGKTVESVVGKGGEFYMENLPPGKFPVKILLDKKECGFKIEIPKSNNTMVDMGEVTCEMD